MQDSTAEIHDRQYYQGRRQKNAEVDGSLLRTVLQVKQYFVQCSRQSILSVGHGEIGHIADCWGSEQSHRQVTQRKGTRTG